MATETKSAFTPLMADVTRAGFQATIVTLTFMVMDWIFGNRSDLGLVFAASLAGSVNAFRQARDIYGKDAA